MKSVKSFSLLLLLLTGCASTTDLDNSARLEILSENSSLPPEHSQNLKITHLWKNKQEALLWIDFNSPSLCGIKYCLYALYGVVHGQKQLLWRAYLDPLLPPSINLIEKDFPCLKINQFNEKNRTTLDQYSLCPHLGKYQITQKQSIALNRS